MEDEDQEPRETADDMEVPDDDVPTIVVPSTKVATKEERIRASKAKNQSRKGTNQESKTS